MAEHARSTVETVVDDLSDDYKDSGGYRPVFNDTVRTVIYVPLWPRPSSAWVS